jgi:hypothetical protein
MLPTHVQDYNMTLTIQSTGDVYTFRKVTAADRTWWETLDWSFDVFLPGTDRGPVFAKKFLRSLSEVRPNNPGQGGYSFHIVELNNSPAAVFEVEYSTPPDSTNNSLDIKNISLCLSPEYRGQGRQKHVLALLETYGAITSGGNLSLKFKIRHAVPQLRALVAKRNADSTDTTLSVTTSYNNIIKDTVHSISLSSTWEVDPRYSTSEYIYSDLQVTNVPIDDPKWAIPELTSQIAINFTEGLI